MTKYDYREAVKDDLIDLINDEFVKRLDAGEFDNLDDFREELNDAAWIDDSVTGNGSGSYTFSTWKAEENLCHNWDFLSEVLSEFGEKFDIDKGAEHYDVVIRCYVLGVVLDDAIEACGIEEDDPRFTDNQEVTA